MLAHHLSGTLRLFQQPGGGTIPVSPEEVQPEQV